jgi:hypothetical protein
MSEWTESARAELEQYLKRARARAGTGADSAEIVEDLRNHVHEEVAAAGIKIVTEEDVRRITARLGLPENPTEEPPRRLAPQPPVQPKEDRSGKGVGLGFLLFFGVILPAVTLGLELVTAMCAATLFDPIPTLFHTALVALVPVVNLLVWRALRTGQLASRDWYGWANGIAVGIGIFYSLLFLPITPIGLIAIIYLGFGLLPLAPLFGLVSTLFLRARLRSAGVGEGTSLPGLWRGIAIGVLAVAALNTPVWVTRINMQRVIAEDGVEEPAGLGWLRMMGDEETMLRACYGWTRGEVEFNPTEWLLSGRRVSPDEARLIYYRVTGHAFNTVPAPKLRTARGGTFAGLNEWTWDEDLGGEKVGGRIKGLTLHSSRLDALVENDAALAYCEWIMEFKNDSPTEREARAQILLPPGAVVSRLTLWVNGEEREAAFAGRSQVRQAYQQVAVQQRRDPVLVNTCGPDRILMQCFPVPRSGGIMKLRIGMSVPVTLDDAGQGIVRLPAFIERNFSIRETLKHSVWVKSKSGKLVCDLLSAANGASLQGQLRDRELASANSLIRVSRNTAALTAWTKDSRAAEPLAFVVQTLQRQNQSRPERVILALDRSTAAADVLSRNAMALASLVTNSACGIVVAGDREPEWLLKPDDHEGVSLEQITKRIRSIRCNGGFDNVPALLSAWDAAAKASNAVVLWVHGPQPVELSSTEPLFQRIERNGSDTDILSFQTELGPNYVLEKLDGRTHVRGMPRLGTVDEDLERLANSWNPNGGHWVRTLEKRTTKPDTKDSIEASDHLVRLWMRDELVRLRKAHRVGDAIPLATRYQLVTPVSGAVVLETAQQYRENNLTPSDPQTVPTIPEPSTFALIVMALITLVLMRRRTRGSVALSA